MKSTAEYSRESSMVERVPNPFASVEGQVRPHRTSGRPASKRVRGKVLFTGGLFGLMGSVFILASPKLGLPLAVAGMLVAGLLSAGATLLARR